MAKTNLTAQRLRELLHYNPETGCFYWRRSNGRRAVAGEIAGVRCRGYQYIRVEKSRYLAHRLAWFYMTESWPTHDIDHIDGDPSNNKWSNLRDVDALVNCQNQRRAHKSNKSTGLIGAHRNGTKWSAAIRLNGKKIYLGQFEAPELAHAAYIEAKRKLHPGCTI